MESESSAGAPREEQPEANTAAGKRASARFSGAARRASGVEAGPAAALADDAPGLVGVTSRSGAGAALHYAGLLVVWVLVPLYCVVVVVGARASQEVGPADLTVNSTVQEECLALHCVDSTYNSPLGDGWRVLVSLVPFLLVIDGILGMNLPSQSVAPYTLFVTVLIGLYLFSGFGVLSNDLATGAGLIFFTMLERLLWTLFDYAFNVFAAFFFLDVLERWGVVRSIQDSFEELAGDATKKIVLVAFCFAIVLAVVAPGGSNFLIAGSILIRMNISGAPTAEGQLESGRRISAICLFGSALTSTFNLLGVCIIAMAEDIAPLVAAAGVARPCAPADLDCARKQIGFQFGLQFLLFCVASPLIMVLLYYKGWNAEIRANLPLMLGCGLVYGVVQLLTAWLLGPELPCLTAAGAALLFYLCFEFLPARLRGEPRQGEPLSWRQAWEKYTFTLPFALLLGLLFLVKLVPGLERALEGSGSELAESVLHPELLDIRLRCAGSAVRFKQRFAWVSNSGMIVMWCAALTPALVPFRAAELDRNKVHKAHNEGKLERHPAAKRYYKVIKASLVEAFHESKPVVIAITAYATLAKVMSAFTMTQSIAQFLVASFKNSPAAYTLFAPLIGTLGASLTGSTTTSNFLFARLQIQTAIELKLVTPTSGSIWAVAGVQILGASGGELISPVR